MSLNGLDHAAVNEAFRVSATEAGGWFLLKYISRDEVELLSQGVGGVAEIRDAVAKYTEPSPLYGFIRYRRRNVLVKYVPPGTSRLLQARLAVHFQSIIDRFTPHDTIFTIAASHELRDSALSAACSLHAASGSTSSSTSSAHRRKLGEIAEDEEEGSTIRARSEITTPTETQYDLSGTKDLKSVNGVTGKRNTVVRYEKPLPLPRSSDETQSPTDRPVTATPSSPSKHDYNSSFSSDTIPNSLHHTDDDIRFSTNSARPSVNELYDSYPYSTKPKVKLGPRPSLDPGKRPHTSGGSASSINDKRPVSTLPPGIRLAQRKPTPTAEKKTPPQRSASSALHVTPPPPVPLPVSPSSSLRPTTSPGKLAAASIHSTRPRSTAITPEKQRLMKAMQLRKKQMAEPTPLVKEKKRDVVLETAPKLVQTLPDESESGLELRKEIEGTLASLNGSDKTPAAIQGDAKHEEDVPTEPSSQRLEHLSALPGKPVDSSSPIEPVAISELPNISEAATASPDGTQVIDKAESKDSVEPKAEEEQSKGEGIESPLDPDLMGGPKVTQQSEILHAAIPSISEAAKRASYQDEGSKGLTDAELVDRNIQSIPQPDAIESSQLTAEQNSQGKVEAAAERPLSNEYQKRRSLVKAINTDTKPKVADEHDTAQLDEDLMEELDSATLHEARPMSVTKSPITPVFGKGSPVPDLSPISARSASESAPQRSVEDEEEPQNTNRFSTITEIPVIETARSVSASNLSTARAQQSPVAIAKKVNVSSGISQRIKALEARSASASSANPSPSGSPSFPSTRSTTLHVPSRAASATGRQSPGFNRSLTPSLTPQADDLHVPKRKNVLVKKEKVEEKPKQSKLSPTSVTVTARIIREAPNQSYELVNGEAHRSPTKPENEAPPKRSMDVKPSLEKSVSAPNVEASQAQTIKNRRSSSSRRRSEASSPPPQSFINGILEEKKESRKGSATSRIMRRMSSISISSRKSIANAISPTLKETEMTFPSHSKHGQAQNIGTVVSGAEVNVQFPDNLLWKRRCLNVDNNGNMTLSPSRTDEYTKISTRRFQLSEFSSPFAPDQDQQELPFSVVLDHLDGGTLQCACENVESQTQLLNALRQAHSALQSSS